VAGDESGQLGVTDRCGRELFIGYMLAGGGCDGCPVRVGVGVDARSNVGFVVCHDGVTFQFFGRDVSGSGGQTRRFRDC
jgi:hypothetical protein